MKTCKHCSIKFESIIMKKVFCTRKCKERFYNIHQYKIQKRLLERKSIVNGTCRICSGACKNFEGADPLCKKCYCIVFKRNARGLSTDTDDVRKDIFLNKTRERRYIDADGYVVVLRKGHPNSNKLGRIRQHILVISDFLKRPISSKETVHHKNGIKDDNRLENLELWSHSHPYGQKVQDKIDWAIDFLKEYGYVVSRA